MTLLQVQLPVSGIECIIFVILVLTFRGVTTLTSQFSTSMPRFAGAMVVALVILANRGTRCPLRNTSELRVSLPREEHQETGNVTLTVLQALQGTPGTPEHSGWGLCYDPELSGTLQTTLHHQRHWVRSASDPRDISRSTRSPTELCNPAILHRVILCGACYDRGNTIVGDHRPRYTTKR
jgi:hypothetical protein